MKVFLEKGQRKRDWQIGRNLDKTSGRAKAAANVANLNGQN